MRRGGRSEWNSECGMRISECSSAQWVAWKPMRRRCKPLGNAKHCPSAKAEDTAQRRRGSRGHGRAVPLTRPTTAAQAHPKPPKPPPLTNLPHHERLKPPEERSANVGCPLPKGRRVKETITNASEMTGLADGFAEFTLKALCTHPSS